MPIVAGHHAHAALVLYGTGLRLGEAARLKHEDVDFGKAMLTIRETKFGKSRLVPMEEILSHLKTLPNATSAALRVRASPDSSDHK